MLANTCNESSVMYRASFVTAGSTSGEDATLLRETGKELAADCVLTSDEALL
jgi:hypothetical protein